MFPILHSTWAGLKGCASVCSAVDGKHKQNTQQNTPNLKSFPNFELDTNPIDHTHIIMYNESSDNRLGVDQSTINHDQPRSTATNHNQQQPTATNHDQPWSIVNQGTFTIATSIFVTIVAQVSDAAQAAVWSTIPKYLSHSQLFHHSHFVHLHRWSFV